jgi:hypothetical protein
MGFGCLYVNPSATTPTRYNSINFDNIIFDNVRRGIWIRETSGIVGTESEPCRMTNLTGRGTSKSFIRMDGCSQYVLIEDFDLDGDRQSGDNFAEDIHINCPELYSSSKSYSAGDIVSSSNVAYKSMVSSNLGNTPASSPSQWQVLWGGAIGGNYDVTVRRGVLRNFHEYVFSSSGVYNTATYWNADALTTERADKRLELAQGAGEILRRAITLFRTYLFSYLVLGLNTSVSHWTTGTCRCSGTPV